MRCLCGEAAEGGDQVQKQQLRGQQRHAIHQEQPCVALTNATIDDLQYTRRSD
jgi:hypothetical protein